MAKLKTYTLGNNGFVRPEVIAMIGNAPHVRQASVLVAAASKAKAIELLDEVGGPNPGLYSTEFRQTNNGPDVTAMAAAGLLDEPAVFATPITGGGLAQPLVRIVRDGQPEWVGVLRRAGSTVEFEAISQSDCVKES
jgi:hypothetical protein